MSRRRRLIHLALAALIVLISSISTTSAGAAGAASSERYSVTIPVSWEMSPERCGRLVATTRGSANMEENGIINRRADGSIEVIVIDVAKGVATDDAGHRYQFSYKNRSTMIIPAAPNNQRVSIQMSDVFSLTGGGPGGTAPYTIGINWRWSYANAGDMPPFAGSWPPGPDLVKVATIGDFNVLPTGLDCDPI